MDSSSESEISAGSVRVSVVMAMFNAARYLDQALWTVRRQSLSALEILVVDDASTDASTAIVRRHAAEDSRIRLFSMAANGGPAAARNVALAHARGDWIAVFDADDLMHPDRLARLLEDSAASDADILADDVLQFEETLRVPPCALLGDHNPARVDLAAYARANVLYGKSIALGYLKPLLRRAFLSRHALRYDEGLRIAEDYDLIARALALGAVFRTTQALTYFYRKHGASISHRLARPAIAAMIAAHAGFETSFPSLSAPARAALAARQESLSRALAFACMIEAFKRFRPLDFIRAARSCPAALALLRLPVQALILRFTQAVGRLVMRALGLEWAQDMPDSPGLVLLTRQRIVGQTNGSSTYLLSLCAHLAQTGLRLHMVVPSPVMFGRWPVLLLRPEMDVFDRIDVRGGLRLGRLIIALDWRIFWRAGLTVLDRLAGKLKLGTGRRMKPAPYAIACPWTREAFLFVARHARRDADYILADYAFLNEGLAYALRPFSRSGCVMHDLFSSRAEGFRNARIADSVASVDVLEEMRLLGQADTVVAVQHTESEIVQRHLPAHEVITALMSVPVVPAAQPGQGQELLFVGSNTAPNVEGLRWFLDEVWPLLRASQPSCRLTVAGTVNAAFGHAGEGVTFAGRVADLDPLYTAAAVVISPLLQGSGLKIKLVEGLAQGKAVVATPVSLQGVETVLAQVVPVFEDAAGFAAEIARLLADPALRAARGEAGLAVMRDAFSPQACYGKLVSRVAADAACGFAARDGIAGWAFEDSLAHLPWFGAGAPDASPRARRQPESRHARSVDVIVPAWNRATTIERAVRSVMYDPCVAQVIVVDDCSTDDTASRVASLAKSCDRVRLVRLAENHGPSFARNRALELGSAPWVSLLDGDDYMEPGRLGQMLDQAWGLDFIADDIIQRAENDTLNEAGQSMLGLAPHTSVAVDFETFVLENIGHSGATRKEMGFLKPLMRRSFLETHGLRYDENVRLGEDYLLYAQALAAGCRFGLVPATGYIAVMRADSLSGRHGRAAIEALREGERPLLLHPALDDAARRAVTRHISHLDCKIQWLETIEAVKARQPARFVRAMTWSPAVAIFVASQLGAELVRRTLGVVGVKSVAA